MAQDNIQALQTILAQELRDLHQPEPIGWWPPAPGWWLLASLTLMLAAYGCWRWWRHRQANRYRKQALDELDQLHQHYLLNKDAARFLEAVNTLLKRTLIAAGQTQATQVSESQWLALLQQYHSEPVPKPLQSALTIDCYRANPEVEDQLLLQWVQSWVSGHQVPVAPRRGGTGTAPGEQHA